MFPNIDANADFICLHFFKGTYSVTYLVLCVKIENVYLFLKSVKIKILKTCKSVNFVIDGIHKLFSVRP